RICVRRNGIWAVPAHADLAAISPDIRLLQAALTATHAPSAQLDRQYPVAAATRLYALILGGLEECLTPGTQIIYAPVGDLVGLPLAVLLSTAPPGTDGMYDLTQAKWAALDYDFSYVPSLKGFLAARQASRRLGADLAFLGVGDPALAAVDENGLRAGQLLARRGAAEVAAALQELPSLPDTRAELVDASRYFPPGGSTLLLGQAATEEAVRLKPLSRYAVIEFATHGLISGDVPGVAEGALVLTPKPGGDEFDDGLLMASEIQSLDL